MKKNELLSYKMIITEELENKIKFICSKINNIEWSGVLFYNYTGTFEDKNLTIIAKDLIVLDIGDAVTTEFNCSNPDVCSYMVENNILDCDMALIHSHHNMATSFSGTDYNTLLHEGIDRNIFVSLIVNNAGNYTAYITRKISSKIQEEICYKTFGDKKICKPIESHNIEYVEYFNLNITKENVINDFPEISNRLNSIKEEKNKKLIDKQKEFLPYQMFNRYNAFDTPKFNKQLTLWDDFEEDKTFKIEDQDLKYTINQSLFDSIIIKMLTGDIIADTTTTTINKAAIKMSDTFNKAFKNFEDFESYASFIVDYIIDIYGLHTFIPQDPNMEDLDLILIEFCNKLGESLTKIIPNKYTEYYSQLLFNYV